MTHNSGPLFPRADTSLEIAFREFVRVTAEYFKDVFPPGADCERICREFMSLERAREQLTLVNNAIDGGLRGRRVLEIGAGCGAQLMSAARDFGAHAVGVEPGDEEFPANINLGRAFFASMGMSPTLVDAPGECLPFADNTFDAVFSFNVLEHVNDPARMLSEAVRVLAPGGTAFILAPNYGSFWEGHYSIPWIPHMPRPMARLFVKIFRRSPKYVDTLNFVTEGRMKRWLRPHAHCIHIVDWGFNIWAARLRTADFSEWAELRRLKRIVQLIGRLGLVPMVTALGKLLRWQTPIILVFRKNNLNGQTPS
jgi:ubiquinone/menaquinone biosynthesis C-methylase UbiE